MSEPKPKNRPQQSCLKCRERKIKCDRLIPCNACTSRGLEAECTYLTTPEDRAHISQAEIIERLRREVSQLRTQLNQTPRGPSPNRNPNSRPRNWAPYTRPQTSKSNSPDVAYAGSGAAYNAAVAGAQAAGLSSPPVGAALVDLENWSWPASSPSSSSTNATGPRTVASPESTGSDSGMVGMSQNVYSAGVGFMPSNPNIMSDIASSHCPPGGITALMPGEIAPSIPMQGTPLPYAHTVQPLPHAMNGSATVAPYMNNEYPTHDHQNYQEPHPNIIDDYEHLQIYHPQWGPQQQFASTAPPVQDSTYYSSSSPPASSISGYTNKNTSADLQPQHPQPQDLENQNTRSSISNMAHSLPSPWKGEGKKELLETLFKTIGSCSEESVAQVVQVVRSSATPEDAVSGICQVLGIGENVR